MNLNLDIEKFESLDYQNYLGKIGVDVRGFKKYFLNKLPSESAILKASEEAFAVLSKRSWDQNTLGVSVYSIDDIYIEKNLNADYEAMDNLIKIIIDHAVINGIKLLTVRFSSEKIRYLQLFEKYGFITVDILATYLFKNEGSLLKSDNSGRIRLANERDYESIVRISKDSFRFSRIYIDDNIPKRAAGKFYAELTRSILAERDNLKLVAEKANKVVGFAVGSIAKNINMFFEKKLGYLWLISVSKSCRGRNIAKKLLNEFLIRFSKQVDFVEISTQISNVSAVNLYNFFGLRPENYIITMHYWNKK